MQTVFFAYELYQLPYQIGFKRCSVKISSRKENGDPDRQLFNRYYALECF